MRKEQINLPGLDCGVCGSRTCNDFAQRLEVEPGLLERCIHLSGNRVVSEVKVERTCKGCGAEPGVFMDATTEGENQWVDSLGREFDFYLEHFPEDPGPREIIIPHNPMITREMNLQVGDVLIGRPLGMSCGCPVTHCGFVMQVDHRTGVMTWCVTGPLNPRQKGFKDIGYYIAEGYEGLVKDTQKELRIGMRYFFQPRMCMLQWRHSGLLNYMSKTADGVQIRLEGLWIG